MRTLVEYGLANAAAATALAAVAVLVGLVVRRPAVRNALWLLVLVRLVLPPVWTVPVFLPGFAADDHAIASESADVIPTQPAVADGLPADDPPPVDLAPIAWNVRAAGDEPAPTVADPPPTALELS